MQIVTPGGCGNDYREGEFYDTISAEPCKVRFRTSDFGQRLVVHCHVMLHSGKYEHSMLNLEDISLFFE
jgi:hypothetical protein